MLVSEAAQDDLEKITPYIEDYCRYFGGDAKALLAQKYYVLSPNPEAGYHQLYTYES